MNKHHTNAHKGKRDQPSASKSPTRTSAKSTPTTPPEYHFSVHDQESHGPLYLKVVSASDLPKLKNAQVRDGWDDDPYVIVTLGDQRFTTRAIQHDLNPIWEEDVTFKILKSHLEDPKAHIHFSIMDLDKKSSDDRVGSSNLDLLEALNGENVPKPDNVTGLYPDGGEIAMTQKVFKLRVKPSKEATPGPKDSFLTIHAKFQPHAATRQHFWRQQFRQADTNHSRKLSRHAIMNLSSTLHLHLDADHVDRFFKERGAVASTDEVAIEEILMYMENTVAGANIPGHPRPSTPPPSPTQPAVPPSPTKGPVIPPSPSSSPSSPSSPLSPTEPKAPLPPTGGPAIHSSTPSTPVTSPGSLPTGSIELLPLSGSPKSGGQPTTTPVAQGGGKSTTTLASQGEKPTTTYVVQRGEKDLPTPKADPSSGRAGGKNPKSLGLLARLLAWIRKLFKALASRFKQK